ncbi:probable protein S-acyltransferase 12 isoform X1 [Lycium barbarum]|uniref:probable protein S-acyltransferase 12 isoform X1 n=1 Tax=Lycium barbarum TaxID=112863 RepID=UPI00293E2585|nr:probable protein S-acyltransferase 12 isoform X1 [Lycium barbarum]
MNLMKDFVCLSYMEEVNQDNFFLNLSTKTNLRGNSIKGVQIEGYTSEHLPLSGVRHYLPTSCKRKLVLLMWSYIKVVIQDPGSVPENWKLVSEQNIEEGNSVALSDYASIENPTSTLSTDQIERRQSQSRGYCSKCHNGKPPRCHHCSVCQRCVLKMDHHCIWVVNCVGARNYKFFLLFVMYTFLTTTLDTLVLLPSFIKFFRQAMNHSLSPGNIAVIFLVFVLNLAFSLSVLCFVIMHASLLSSNTTSVEVYEKKKTMQWKYDLGWKRNFEQVFGANKALWFFPLFSKKDLENIPALHGLEFPTRSDAEE